MEWSRNRGGHALDHPFLPKKRGKGEDNEGAEKERAKQPNRLRLTEKERQSFEDTVLVQIISP